MPFLKDFLINNSTKIILWKIIPGELSDKHLSEEEKNLLKIRKEKNQGIFSCCKKTFKE